MTFLTLISDDNVWAATDQRVYDASDVPALESLVEQTRALSASVEQHRQEAEVALHEARERGYAEGLRQGLAERRATLAETALELREQHARSIEEQRAACVALALDVVRKIAADVAPSEWLHAQAVHAARSMIEAPRITLRVSPERVAEVARAVAADGTDAIERVIADDELGLDDCLLDTGAGTVDVSMDTQLAAIVQLFDSVPTVAD